MYWNVGPSTFFGIASVLACITIISSFMSTENIDAQIIPQSDGNTSNPNATISDPITLDNVNILGASGTFASSQNDSDNTVWITSGKWSISTDPSDQSGNSSGIQFNATVDMVQTNNPDNHRNKIYDFRFSDGSINSTGEATTIILNGSASIDTNIGLYIDVPISVRIVDKEPIIVSIDTQSNRVIPKWIPGGGTISLWIDSAKTEDHFGDTPIYGIVKRA